MQLLFALTLFTSAALLFVVQPMFAKMVLPLLGGTPAVWNTCMVFYQAALLAGYVYAHLTVTRLGPRRQAALHLPLMLLPWLVLPIGVGAGWAPPTDANPVPWLLALLALSVGLPFLFVAASAPMLQAWFAATGAPSARDPYWLYAASNAGSMLGLLGYPLLLEPRLTLSGQARWWAGAYAGLMVLTAACAAVLWRAGRGAGFQPAGTEPAPPEGGDGGAPTWTDRVWWLALSFAPSSLLLGVTTYISTDLASVPLLWVAPLALYLLTFVLVFARWRIIPHRLLVWLQPVLVVTVAASFYMVDVTSSSVVTLVCPLHLLAFFVTAMVCHGELAARRPGARHLTEFYLWMSLGGVLGGMFNALAAPRLFVAVYEYPMMIAAACLLRPQPAQGPRRAAAWAWDFGAPLALALLYGRLAHELSAKDWLADSLGRVAPAWVLDRMGPYTLGAVVFLGMAAASSLLLVRRPVRFGLAVFGLLAVGLIYSGEKLRPLYAARSFFGVMRVKEVTFHAGTRYEYKAHQLHHGSTNHGMQSLDPDYRYEPWTYYHRTGPVGAIFDAMSGPREPREIGVVGLGTGTMAAYGEPGRRITFFEIDPAVQAIAENPALFTYVTDCRESGGEVRIVLGDARLKLREETQTRFDLLLIDAFSSDAIPVHLLTREAIRLYFDRLGAHGLLAVHISNRHFDLKPVLGNLAEEAGLTAVLCDDGDEEEEGKYTSTWVVLARDPDDVGPLRFDFRWTPLPTDPAKRPWTDDFSNVVDVLELDWDRDLDWLLPWKWIRRADGER